MRGRLAGWFAFGWATGGVLAVLLEAIVRLLPRVLSLDPAALDLEQWLFGGAWVALMAFAEGRRGFQGRFNPRVVARAWRLRQDPRPLRTLLAPIYAMALFGAPAARVRASWGLVVGLVCLIEIVRHLPTPWRELVDAGVVVGLSWGAADLVGRSLRAAAGRAPEADPEDA